MRLHAKNKKVALRQIKIPENLKHSIPSSIKFAKHLDSFRETFEIEKIYIDSEGYLIDGYISYLIAKAFDLEKVNAVIIQGS